MTAASRAEPAHPNGRWWTLRRVLLTVTLTVTSVATVAMVASALLAISWRDAGERETAQFLEDQRAVYHMIELARDQQLYAYRAIDTPQEEDFALFHKRGDEAYREIHDYLFRDLARDVRLKAEGVKEAHQQFEVAAQRTIDLIRLGHSDALVVRLDSMDIRAAALDAAAAALLQARSLQRDVAVGRYLALSGRLRGALVVLTIAFACLGVLLAGILRSVVLRPLDQLADAADRLGKGKADARVPVQAYREFDTVATGFNLMADRVEAAAGRSLAQNRALQEALDHLRATQEEMVQLEKLSAMGEMLAGLAHELNNPLSGVVGMAEQLRLELADAPDPRSRKLGVDLAAPLEREALRAGALVRSLLSFARKPAGALQSVELDVAVRTAVGIRMHAFLEARKELEVHVPAGLIVLADRQKMQHAIVNVVNNALDALVEGGGTRLDIRATATHDAVVLEFDDDGPGLMTPGEVFDPFFTTKEPGKGTGLGLSLVQRFMHEFEGSASASNRPEGGARITLSFKPAMGVESANLPGETAADTLAPPEIADSAITPAPPPAQRQRILVVDDEYAIREIERRALERAGYDVRMAASGVEARDLLLNGSFDLVVSDLRMPGEMDGAALIDWMRKERPALARTALLATGNMTGPEHAALPLPPARIITKPFRGTDLVASVRGALASLPVDD